MCLVISGQIVEVVDETLHLANVDVAGVRRNVNIRRLDAVDDAISSGDRVLIHVGVAPSKGDEPEAHAILNDTTGNFLDRTARSAEPTSHARPDAYRSECGLIDWDATIESLLGARPE